MVADKASEKNGRIWAILMALAVQILYGANYTVVKELIPTWIGPFPLILIRVGVSWMLFHLFVFLFIKERTVERSDQWRFFLCAVFGVLVNMSCFFSGLALTSPVNAAIIMVCTPILVSVLAYFWYKESLSKINITGIAIGFCGAVFLIQQTAASGNEAGDAFGDFLIFVNAISYALYLVMVRPLIVKYNPIVVIRSVFNYGLLLVLPLGLYFWSDFKYVEMPGAAWLELAYVVIGTTFLTYLFNASALRKLRSSVLGSFIYLQPLLASFFAWLSSKYEIYSFQIIAGLIIAVGVFLASRPIKKAPSC